jgi:hypothetical protein
VPVTRTELSQRLTTFVRSLLARLNDNVEELAELIVQDLTEQVPFWGELDGGVLDQVRDAVIRTTHAYVDGWTPGRRLAAPDIAAIEALAVRLKSAGLGHSELTAGIQVAARRAMRYLVAQAAEASSSRTSVIGVGELLIEALGPLDDAGSALSRGWIAQDHDELSGHVQAERDLLDDLLAGIFKDDDELMARADVLGQDLNVPHGFLLIAAPGGSEGSRPVLRQARDACLTRLSTAVDATIRTSPAPHAIVFVTSPQADTWMSAVSCADQVAAEHGVIIVCVEPVVGPTVLHQAYQRAAERIGVATNVAAPGVLTPNDLDVYHLLATRPDEARMFLNTVLGPALALPPRSREAVLETLQALSEHTNRGEMAEALHVDDRTIYYRFDRVKDVTGRDPRNPQHLLQLKLAYHAYRLFSEPNKGN